MTGGTALAGFYLGHRLSEDLDFFTADPGAVKGVLPVLEDMSRSLKFTFRVERLFPTFLDGDLVFDDGTQVKVDFALDSPFRLKPVKIVPPWNIRVDSDLDIACNKISALFDRAEPKDFVDVYFIVKELFSWEILLENAAKKHVGLEPHFLAKAFLRVRDLRVLPRMVKAIEREELDAFFLRKARELLDRLS